MSDNQIVIYQTEDGRPAIDVRLESETLWLSQRLMAELFDKDSDTIGLHIRNIYTDGELEEKATTEDFSVVRKEGQRMVKRTVIHYNLDVILSVGYRVNSKRGTQFRIWANNVLKAYLIQGYALNDKRLTDQKQQFDDLKQAVRLMGNVLESRSLTGDEAKGLMKVLDDYTYALDVLDKYDHQQLTITKTSKKQAFVATYEEAIKAIQGLRDKFGGSRLFGNEKTNLSEAPLPTSTNHSVERTCTPVLRKRQRISCILSPKTILFQMGISG